MGLDWWEWHLQYDEPGSPLRLRTEVVHHHIRAFLDSCRPGPVRIVSICAGQGRELLPVVAAHPRREDVRARLIELDARNVAAACEAVGDLRLDWNVDIVCGDASVTDAYAGAVPADLLLVCGVFGCLDDADTLRMITELPQLCAPGATVVWTRQRQIERPVAHIRAWFREGGFCEEAFESPGPEASWVGVERFAGEPRPLIRGARLFTFRSNGDRP
jgi:hypothetical protein